MNGRAGPFGRRCHQSGQSTAEFFLIISAFFLILFGMMETAQAVFTYNSICEAAREAVRYAIVHGPNSVDPSVSPYTDIQQVAINAVPDLALTSANVVVSWPADPNISAKKDPQVKVSYTYSLSPIPFLPSISVPLTATSQMLVSQ